MSSDFNNFYVDIKRCIACGYCINVAGDNFFERDDGYSYVKNQPKDDDSFKRCEIALRGCPVEAIKK